MKLFGGCASSFAGLLLGGLAGLASIAFARLLVGGLAGFDSTALPGPLLGGFAGLSRTALPDLLAGALDGLALAASPGLLGATLAGFAPAALIGCDPRLIVLGRALGLVAGLYAVAVKGAEWPTGIARADGAILVTTGWVASVAGGRAEAAAGRATPATLCGVGATGLADTTLGLEICSDVILTDAVATGFPP